MQDCTDDHTKKRRRLHDLTGWLHDGLTNGKIYIRIQHENEPSQCLWAIFSMPKILEPLTKLLPELEILSRGSYDDKRCPHE
jgi:hypothetical protein